jgi:hypothetical protein
MPVYKDSRYAEVEYTSILGRDQVTRKYLHPRDPKVLEEVNQDWSAHISAYGDELDLLAYQYSGENASKAKYWWIIADINNILWPLDIEPGTNLVIPTKMIASRGLRG